MRVLLDTNIIIRAAQPNLTTWLEINQALTALVAVSSLSQTMYMYRHTIFGSL